MDQFFTDSKLKNKVTMLRDLADSVGITMLGNGDDPSAVTQESFDKAIDTIKGAVDSGQIQDFMGNEYSVPLARGELAAAIAWAGDVIQLLTDNPHLRWGIPDTGGMIWTDNMFIPTGGSVPTASTLMNFYYDPAIAAQVGCRGRVHLVRQGRQGRGREARSRRRPRTSCSSRTRRRCRSCTSTTRRRSTTTSTSQAWQSVLGAVGGSLPTWAPSSTGIRG